MVATQQDARPCETRANLLRIDRRNPRFNLTLSAEEGNIRIDRHVTIHVESLVNQVLAAIRNHETDVTNPSVHNGDIHVRVDAREVLAATFGTIDSRAYFEDIFVNVGPVELDIDDLKVEFVDSPTSSMEEFSRIIKAAGQPL